MVTAAHCVYFEGITQGDDEEQDIVDIVDIDCTLADLAESIVLIKEHNIRDGATDTDIKNGR